MTSDVSTKPILSHKREISCLTRWQVEQIMKQTFRNAHMSFIVCLVTKCWKDSSFCGKHAWRTLIRRGTITNGESFLKRETGVRWRHCSKPTFRTGGVRVRVQASHVKVNGASLCGRGAVRSHGRISCPIWHHIHTRELACQWRWRSATAHDVRSVTVCRYVRRKCIDL